LISSSANLSASTQKAQARRFTDQLKAKGYLRGFSSTISGKNSFSSFAMKCLRFHLKYQIFRQPTLRIFELKTVTQ
jgi:hypothetical protein